MPLDESATVTWADVSNVEPIKSILQRAEFEFVGQAVLFVMENMAADNRRSAMIHTDNENIEFPEIETLYQQIKNSRI